MPALTWYRLFSHADAASTLGCDRAATCDLVQLMCHVLAKESHTQPGSLTIVGRTAYCRRGILYILLAWSDPQVIDSLPSTLGFFAIYSCRAVFQEAASASSTTSLITTHPRRLILRSWSFDSMLRFANETCGTNWTMCKEKISGLRD